MEFVRTRFWRMPDRLSPRRARLLAVLGVAVLAFSGLVAGASDVPSPRLAAGFLGLVGLANLAQALGSLLPEPRGGRVLLAAARPLTLLVLLAGLAWVALALKATIVDGEDSSWLHATGGVGGALLLADRWRHRRRNGASR